jgi:hypothetical protein
MTPRRTRFFAGKLLTPEDFEREQQYALDKARRHNLRLHGAGIVAGLDVTLLGDDTNGWSVRVAPGVAIDPLGNEIEVVEFTEVALPALDGTWLLILRYVELPGGAVATSGGEEAAYIDETFDLALHAGPEPPVGALAIAMARRRNGAWKLKTKRYRRKP